MKYWGVFRMEKDIYLKDYLVSRIISFGKEIPGYGKVYYRTNEDLETIYKDLDLHKKATDLFYFQNHSLYQKVIEILPMLVLQQDHDKSF